MTYRKYMISLGIIAALVLAGCSSTSTPETTLKLNQDTSQTQETIDSQEDVDQELEAIESEIKNLDASGDFPTVNESELTQ